MVRPEIRIMPDPTFFAITAAFGAALCLFIMAALVKRGGMRGRERSWRGAPDLGADASPFQPPRALDPPAVLPPGGVPTWFYRRMDLIGIACVYAVFSCLVVMSLMRKGGEDLELDVGGLLVSIGFQVVTAGMVTAWVVGRVGMGEWLGLRWTRGWQVVWIAPGAVFGMWLFFGGLQVTGYMKWIESFGVEAVQDTVKLLQESDDRAIVGLMIVAAVLVAPVCEEIVFRGYLYAASKKFAGSCAAGACSALVFAAAHGSLAALLPLFVFGCLLALIYEKTGSIWAPIAIHFCFNGATVLVQVAARYYEIPLEGGL
jgi:membrane protease YdiL (CAAX protease family)